MKSSEKHYQIEVLENAIEIATRRRKDLVEQTRLTKEDEQTIMMLTGEIAKNKEHLEILYKPKSPFYFWFKRIFAEGKGKKMATVMA